MENLNLFYNKNPFHNLNINKKNFCSICYKITDHNILDCPYKCSRCNGYHKTDEHRCLICNVRNPDHNINQCNFIINTRHL